MSRKIPDFWKQMIVYYVMTMITLTIVGLGFWFVFPLDAHCVCDDGDIITGHKMGLRNFDEYCQKFGDCKTFSGLDIDGQWEEMQNVKENTRHNN